MCPIEAHSLRPAAAAAESAWSLVLAASALADGLEREGRALAFGVDERGDLQRSPADGAGAVLAWQPELGWKSRMADGDPRSDLIDLYLPICSATAARPITVGHLGQSLDGFIATHSGDSRFVSGDSNLVHLHRMRALCDAVVVGAGTVAADDPQLTTRHVQGTHPLRVIFDPERRLTPSFGLFTDQAAETLYICEKSRLQPGESTIGHAAVMGIDGGGVADALRLLRARGCSRVFVEGGGVTVSAFLEANLLDRLQIAIAPVIIGDGRPSIRLAPQERLRDCLRPGYRVFRMGGDVLFDCEMSSRPKTEDDTVRRVI